MRVFLSHSSEDKSVARACSAAFTRSGVDVWDYLSPVNQNSGAVLEDDLVRQILACEVFVGLVSAASLANPLCRREVDIASNRGFADGRMFGIVARGAPPRAAWGAPFDVLARRVYERVDNDDDVEPAVGRILSALHVTLAPATPSHARLPVRERTLRELETGGARAARAVVNAPQAFYNALLVELDGASKAYVAGQYAAAGIAFDRARIVLSGLSSEFRPYYLGIARAVCELHAGNDDAARRTLDDIQTHPLRDESWLAAYGIIELRRGRRDTARVLFRRCLEQCRTTGQSELEVLVHLCQLDPDDSYIPVLDAGSTLTPRERLILRCVRARRDLDLGRPRNAVAELRALTPAERDEDVTLLLVEALDGIGDVPAALAELRAFLAAHPEGGAVRVARVFARHLVAVGRPARACEVYAALLGDRPLGREGVWTEHARALRLAGSRESMRLVCERIVEDSAAGMREPEAIYCVGLAYYLLEQHTVADAMWTLSREYGGRRYVELIADDDNRR